MRKKETAATAASATEGRASAASGMRRSRGGLWLAISAILLGLALGAAAANYWFEDETNEQHLAMERQASMDLTKSRADLAMARAQVDALTGQLALEASTRRGLESSLKEAQAELGRARDQMAFFDQLLPPGPKGAISIRGLDIEQVGPTLQYRVLLMRNGADGAPFKGLMQFVAKGMQDGKAAKIVLQAVRPNSDQNSSSTATAAIPDDQYSLDFDQFQRSGGLLKVPDGFTVQTVTLNVLEGTAVRVSRSVNVSASE